MLERAEQLADQMVEWRRHLHQHPELGFEERETARFVVETLRPLGLTIREGVGKTGVVAELGPAGGDREGPIVAIRADMDALPVEEQSGVRFCSRRPGVMHACGHDAHVAMGLGAAYLLHEYAQRHALPGRIRFLFQPCEETADAEHKSGAQRMVEDGAMEGVAAVVGQHVEPMTPVGRILLASGPIAAAPDDFHITIHGHGTHAASPHQGVDPIWLSAQVLNAIYALRGRLTKPTAPAIITVGQIHGGTTENVIPPEVTLSGTIRTFDADTRRRLHAGLEQACAIARTFGGDFSLSINGGCPALVNDERVTAAIREVAEGLIGAERIGRDEPQCGAEDFAVLATAAPGGFWQLGVRSEEDSGECFDCHDPRFVLDERALPLGAAMLASSALRLLDDAAAKV
ncbi:MAG TPA: M20 family metallopeptidase [Ktedonobacterales bacterium]